MNKSILNCQVLDDSRNPCKNKANKFPYSYFGDTEMNQGCDWVGVYMCSKHSKGLKIIK